MPKPVTRAEFGALVDDLRAELAVTEGLRRREFFTVPRRAAPDAFKGRPWVRQHVGAYEVADLAEVTIGTVRDLDYRGRRARDEGKARNRRLMPPSEVIDGKRQWAIGEIALWVASRGDRHPPRPQRKPPKPRKQLPAATDEQLLDVVRRAVKKHGPAVNIPEVQVFVRGEGLGAKSHRVAPVLMRARIEHVRNATLPTDGLHGGELESLRHDGLVTPTQVGAAFGVSVGAVSHAVERGGLTPVKYEGGPLFDPQRLAIRKDGTKGPVDKDSPLAVDMELD